MTTVIENMSLKERLISNLDTYKGQAIASEKVRKGAAEVVAATAFPTNKHEEWKYSNTSPILELDLYPASAESTVTAAQINPFLFSKTANVLVFVNGIFSENLSKINEAAPVFLGSLSEAKNTHAGLIEKHLSAYAKVEGEVFTALNTAYSSDGAFIYVPAKAIVKEPVQLLFINQAGERAVIAQPRVLVVAENHSQVSIVESYHSLSQSAHAFTNAVTEVVLEENAVVEHYKIQSESNHSYHIGTTQVHQQKSSIFNSFVITLNGLFVRNNLTTVLDAQGIESHLFGLYLPQEKQHVDNHTLVDHQKPHCNSNEIYKGIIDGHGSGVFNGKIFVRKDAQKTNAFQSNKNILLSDFAKMDSKPQLEIFADDVKCSHGSTTGQFDDEAMFYMRSRGIGEDKAKNLLMFAFASEIIEAVKHAELKEYLYKLLSVRLHHDFS